jgi:hypothetical protein
MNSHLSLDIIVRFQVLTVASMKVTVLLDLKACSLAEIDWRFSGDYCLHHLGNNDGDLKRLWNVRKYWKD